MNKEVLLELVWWVFTAVLVLLFILPIWLKVDSQFPFYLPNIVFIVLFITFTRLIFLTKHTFLSKKRILKLIFIFLPIPIFFYASDQLFDFQNYLDQGDYIPMLSHLDPNDAVDIFKYIKYQFLFFGSGAIIVIFLMPIRMIVSIWSKMNRGVD